MKYFVEWLKSFDLGFSIKPHMLEVNILIISFFIGVQNSAFTFGLSIRLPKYAFILSPGEHFFYKNSSYWFYRKILSKYMKFYIMHVMGENAILIPNKKSEWV